MVTFCSAEWCRRSFFMRSLRYLNGERPSPFPAEAEQKPHTKAESFCGLLNFSVSRETHPCAGLFGSLPIQRRRMIPAHFICWNHFYSFLSVQTRVQETRRSGPPESRRTLSRRNHFPSFLPGETGAQGARRSGSPGCTTLFFEGTSFPHSFRHGPQPWKPRDRARRDAPHFFSREPLFLIPSG